MQKHFDICEISQNDSKIVWKRKDILYRIQPNLLKCLGLKIVKYLVRLKTGYQEKMEDVRLWINCTVWKKDELV